MYFILYAPLNFLNTFPNQYFWFDFQSDFYKYEVDRNKWTKITEDTSKDGGPMLIFDHQMCIDSDKSKIYVFGGQSLVIR